MTEFESLFAKAKKYKISHNEEVYYLKDIIQLPSKGCIEFESISVEENSTYKQGVSFQCSSEVVVNEVKFKEFGLWYDSAPKITRIVNESDKDIIININNVSEDERGVLYSLMNGSAMKVEEKEDGSRVYYCNDNEADDDFVDLVFSLRMSNEKKVKSLVDENPEEYNKF